MEFEKDLLFIEDFNTLVMSIVLFIKEQKDKTKKRCHLGSEITHDCTIFFNRETWKKLLSFMLEKQKKSPLKSDKQKQKEQKEEKKKKGGMKNFNKKIKKAFNWFGGSNDNKNK